MMVSSCSRSATSMAEIRSLIVTTFSGQTLLRWLLTVRRRSSNWLRECCARGCDPTKAAALGLSGILAAGDAVGEAGAKRPVEAGGCGAGALRSMATVFRSSSSGGAGPTVRRRKPRSNLLTSPKLGLPAARASAPSVCATSSHCSEAVLLLQDSDSLPSESGAAVSWLWTECCLFTHCITTGSAQLSGVLRASPSRDTALPRPCAKPA
mmetsp:Transcript_6354/g.15071  ORF Transcript_6354/g.15071 Transcript_6354/m.15071 type:complete len:209 (-) Transcript_6354:307-933(-)